VRLDTSFRGGEAMKLFAFVLAFVLIAQRSTAADPEDVVYSESGGSPNVSDVGKV
jgi:hypothetical protein